MLTSAVAGVEVYPDAAVYLFNISHRRGSTAETTTTTIFTSFGQYNIVSPLLFQY